MAPYGFSVNLDGNVLAQMKKIEQGLQSMARQTTDATKKVQDSFKGMQDSARDMGRVLIEAFAVERIYEFGKELLHLTAKFQGFENVIKYSSMNSFDAAQNMDYITGAVKRLHLPMEEAIESFSEMQAGFFGTGIEGKRMRDVFEGVSTAATVLHLSAYRFSNVTFALKEIGELGTLQSRQMRMLAFALPGAMNIAAKSMHMNTRAFHEAMKKGLINSGVFLQNFSAALKEHFQKGLANAGNSFISKMNDVSNAFLKLKLQLGENLAPQFVKIMDGIQQAFNSAPVKYFVAHIAGLVSLVMKIIPMWLIYKTVMISIGLVTRYFAVSNGILTASFGEATVMIQGTTIAAEGFGSALIATGVGAFAVALGLIVEQFMNLNKEMDEAMEKVLHLSTLQGGIKEIRDAQKTSDRQYAGIGKFSGEEKSQFLSQTVSNIAEWQNKINTQLQPQLDDAKKNRRNYTEKTADTDKMDANIRQLTEQLKEVKGGITTELGYVDALKRQGIKPWKGSPMGGGGGAVHESSLHTAELAGAKGGLGEAKTITIHFHDALQKVSVNVPAGIKTAAQDAVGVILRTLNNLAYGQSKTM